ncbi:ammonia-dependent NAD(+) synthetase [Arcanobacterium hippocoleae]|uniref:ammonia-dependent NAD(+) synthetase n=1 Tax=Arcanobacterium hippocoleae TaxID=149017 RepID=UPI003341724B
MLQHQIISELGVKPTVNYEIELAQRVNFLVEYLQATRAKGYVLGISGGVDSTLGGRLAQLAAERVRAAGGAAEFIAVRLPHHIQRDEADAQAALEFINPDRLITYNIGATADAMEAEYAQSIGVKISDFNKGNIKARLRMTAQYAIAGDLGMLVVGTDHAAEAVTGFYTKYGDGGADLTPLSGLNKRQVRGFVKYLGGGAALVGKVPTADLLDGNPGRTDEDELGLRYDDIDDYLEGKIVPRKLLRGSSSFSCAHGISARCL